MKALRPVPEGVLISGTTIAQARFGRSVPVPGHSKLRLAWQGGKFEDPAAGERCCARPRERAQEAPPRTVRWKVTTPHCFRILLRPRTGALRPQQGSMLVAGARDALKPSAGHFRLWFPAANGYPSRHGNVSSDSKDGC